MQNLLPPSEKKKVIMEYRLRLAVVPIFSISILMVANLALLAPSYLLAVSKSTFMLVELSKLEEKEVNRIQERDVYAKIKEINKNIGLFLKAGNSNKSVPSELVIKIISIKNLGIKITGFSYDATLDRERIVLSGRADDRESLAKFLEDLKKDKTFTKVELPISSFVKSLNIEFSLVLEKSLIVPAQKK